MSTPARDPAMNSCYCCHGEPEPGWIEMPNNGPIVPCPICNPLGSKEAQIELAWQQHDSRDLMLNKEN